MPQVIFYNVGGHEHAMGVLVVIYFFLSGLGAGAFLAAAGCRFFGGDKYAKVEKTAAIAAPLLLMPGLICLLLDLGKPFRFFNLMLYFNPSSVASWGVWVINIFMAISVIYAAMHITGKTEKARPLACVGLVFALGVGLYSGLLLYQMRGYELWHSALVPPIFLASAMASGLAAVLLLAGSAVTDQARMLGKVLAAVLGVELVLALTEILTITWSSGAKAAAGNVVLSGGFGFLFLAVYLVLGLALPLVFLARRQSGRAAQVLAAILVLTGTLAMRYVVVIGGQVPPLS